MNKEHGFVFYIKGDKKTTFPGHPSVVTEKGTIGKMFVNTILSLENGQRIDGYVKPIREDGEIVEYEFCPRQFKLVLNVLNELKAYSELIDEDPKSRTKGKYIIVNLTPEQEAELQRLKALCK